MRRQFHVNQTAREPTLATRLAYLPYSYKPTMSTSNSVSIIYLLHTEQYSRGLTLTVSEIKLASHPNSVSETIFDRRGSWQWQRYVFLQ